MVLSQTEFLAKRIELKPDFEKFSDRRTKVAGFKRDIDALGSRGSMIPALTMRRR